MLCWLKGIMLDVLKLAVFALPVTMAYRYSLDAGDLMVCVVLAIAVPLRGVKPWRST